LTPLASTVRRKPCVVLAIWLAPMASAYAQSQGQGPAPTLVRGAFTLESSLGIEVRQDDNIFQSPVDEQSSQISMLTPSLLMRLGPSGNRFELKYDGEYAWYQESSNDDYGDHALEAGTYLLLGRRSGLDFVALHENKHENRGTGLTEGFDPASGTFPEEPDRYTTEQFLARYTYGVTSTRAILAFEASTQKRTYDNNLERTQQFDRDATYGQATFGVRVRPNTSLQLSLRTTDITYPHPRASGQSLDSRESRYLVGVQWEATAKTTGSVRVGRVDKEYDDPSHPTFSGPNWEVAIRWSPRTYSHIDLSTERFPEETTTTSADVRDTKTYSLSWTHEWNDRLETQISGSRIENAFREDIQARVQDLRRYRLALNYDMRSWLTWELALEANSRDSKVDRFKFDGKIVRIGARIIF
jgi:polysaccharide biosynthesis protein VpsM